MKFKVDKWYKIDDNQYLKYKYSKKEGADTEIYGERINWGDYNKLNCFSSYCHLFNEAILLENLSEISQWLPENHVDKQLKPEDFIGKWVTTNEWRKDSYCLVKNIEQRYRTKIYFYKSITKNLFDLNDEWLIYNLSDLKIVTEAEVAKKAIEYGHDLRELGLHQFISVSKTIKKEDLYNAKIWIGDNEELSRKIQEKLFELGFEWGIGKIHSKNITSIYLNPGNKLGEMKCKSNNEFFNSHKFKEITLSDLGLEETVIDCDGFIYNQPIEIIPIIQTTSINIPEIKLNNLKLTI